MSTSFNDIVVYSIVSGGRDFERTQKGATYGAFDKRVETAVAVRRRKKKNCRYYKDSHYG